MIGVRDYLIIIWKKKIEKQNRDVIKKYIIKLKKKTGVTTWSSEFIGVQKWWERKMKEKKMNKLLIILSLLNIYKAESRYFYFIKIHMFQKLERLMF